MGEVQDSAREEASADQGEGLRPCPGGRFGSVAVSPERIEAVRRAIALAPGERLRIAFISTTSDVTKTAAHYVRGELGPGAAMLPYSTQALDLAQAMDAALQIVFPADGTPVPEPGPGVRFGQYREEPADGFVELRRNRLAAARSMAATLAPFDPHVTVVTAEHTWLTPKSLPGRTIFSFHQNLWRPDRARPPMTERVKLIEAAFALRRWVDGAVCVSQAAADQLRWLTNGEMKAEVCAPQQPAALLEKPSLPPAEPRVVFVGRVERYKGPFDLLSALAKLRNEVPGLHLTIVGDGASLGDLRTKIDAGGHRDWVTLTGTLDGDAVKRVIAESRLLVCPTRSEFREGLPKTAAEAHLMGRPVVASSVCPTLSEGSTLIYEADNLSALENTLRSVLTDGGVYARLAEAAREGREIYLDRSRSWASKVFSALEASLGLTK